MKTRDGSYSIVKLLMVLAICTLTTYPVPAAEISDTDSLSACDVNPPITIVVTGTTHNTTDIRIMTMDPCTPVIHYSDARVFPGDRTASLAVAGIRSCSTHVLRLTGLNPGTRYYYHVTGCGTDDKIRSFTTFPANGTCRFVVYGDTREQLPLFTQAERHAHVADRIAEENDILFVVNSGDLVADSNSGAEWSRFFNATEQLRSRTTYIAVPGNHDQDRVLFGRVFGMNRPYFFDCGDARILLLDSTDDAGYNLSQQAAMTSSAFATFSGAKIVILHHPPYSSDEKHYGGWENLQKQLVPVFEETGVRLVFSSHVHAFEQVERNGIMYITEARGGAPAYPLNKTRITGSATACENTLGYSLVTVDPEAGMIMVDVIRVADVSEDLRTVTTIHPVGTMDTKIRIPMSGSTTRLQDISGQLCFLNSMKDYRCSHNSERNIANWLP